ncbi:Apolipoprotein N-acyltransferase-like protein [Parafrankia sp. EUN1f]|nr:Apolipoprotein N-acyltransferase-like protein [Parafrankia sp. EUN1f]
MVRTANHRGQGRTPNPLHHPPPDPQPTTHDRRHTARATRPRPRTGHWTGDPRARHTTPARPGHGRRAPHTPGDHPETPAAHQRHRAPPHPARPGHPRRPAALHRLPPIGWWPLAPVAVAVLTLTVRGRRLRASYGLGLLFSLGFLLPLLRFVSFVGADGWIVLSTAEAAILAVIAPATTLAWRLPAAPLWTGAAWVAQEALRGRAPFGGFPWGRLAFSQPDSPYTGLAALGGAPLVTFAVATTAALLATTAIHLHTQAPAWGRRRPPRPAPSHPTPPHGTRRPTLALTATAATAGALTLAGLAIPLPTAAQHGTLQVAAIQGDVPEAGGYHALGRAMQVTTNHVQGTENLAAAVRAGTTPNPTSSCGPRTPPTSTPSPTQTPPPPSPTPPPSPAPHCSSAPSSTAPATGTSATPDSSGPPTAPPATCT